MEAHAINKAQHAILPLMHCQRLVWHRGGRLARDLICRAMMADAANAAPTRKRRRESAAAEGRQTALQWGDSFSLPGLAVQNLSMRVPLDHEQPEGEELTIFARLVSSSSRSKEPTGPFLLFLQGIPVIAPPRLRFHALFADLAATLCFVSHRRRTSSSRAFPLTSAEDGINPALPGKNTCTAQADLGSRARVLSTPAGG